MDEWIPVCTGMTIGGVAAVSEFSSLQLIFVRLFLSVFYLVILADAGIHRTASVVARYYRFVTSIVVGFALCSCWLWQVRFQTRHLARVDKWFPVCTGMTTRGAWLCAECLCESGAVDVPCLIFVIPTSSL
ncbi:hypothetical protein M2H36_19500 [Vibrio vulnificus]|nr:hypothetical protein [Vibrio vulnificus]